MNTFLCTLTMQKSIVILLFLGLCGCCQEHTGQLPCFSCCCCYHFCYNTGNLLHTVFFSHSIPSHPIRLLLWLWPSLLLLRKEQSSMILWVLGQIRMTFRMQPSHRRARENFALGHKYLVEKLCNDCVNFWYAKYAAIYTIFCAWGINSYCPCRDLTTTWRLTVQIF